MKTVQSRLRVLIAEKSHREKRRLSLRKIAEESGASLSAVVRLENDTIKLIPRDDLAALCRWIPCEPGDLLTMEEVKD